MFFVLGVTAAPAAMKDSAMARSVIAAHSR